MHGHLQDNITPDNYEEILVSLSEAVSGAAINDQVQTTSNLAVVAAAFLRSAALISERTIILNEVSYWCLSIFAQYNYDNGGFSPATCYLSSSPLLFRQCRI